MKISLREFRKGDGIEFKLFGIPGTFRLAFKKEYQLFNKEAIWYPCYVNIEAGLYTTGVYSGGNTGFGTHEYELRKLNEIEYKILPLEDVERVVKEAQERERKEREINRERIKKVKSIIMEKLAVREYDLGVVKVRIKVTVDVNPDRLKPFLHISLVKDDNDERKLWLSDYITTDRKIQYKKFVKDYAWWNDKMNKETLLEIIEKVNEVKNEIKNVKNEVKIGG